MTLKMKAIVRHCLAVGLTVLLLTSVAPHSAAAKTDAIWIAPAQAERRGSGGPGQVHQIHEGHGEDSKQQSGRPSQTRQAESSGRSGRPSGSGSHGGHGGHDSSSGRFESEHRPLPVRTYKIIPQQLLPEAWAKMLQADGTEKDLAIETCHTNVFSLKMPMDDSPLHGPNNIYVFDQQVKDGVLEVRTAKWLTIHHSCGWGHEYRNDPERLAPRSLESAPLDIVVDNLWNGNFHNALHSGDELVIHVYSYGKPVADATVTISTEKGWTIRKKTDAEGTARVQLIRDYYPETWQVFKRTQLGRLALTAEYSEEGKSSYGGKDFNRTHFITSFSWKYVPAGEDYNSYSYGLLVGSLGFLGSGFGVYHYRLKRKKPRKTIVF